MIESLDSVGGQPLGRGQVFRFACRPGLACFGQCCAGKRLPLLPYDLLRLKRALGLDSAQVLERHVELEEDPASGWPALRIRLTDQNVCPFRGDDGLCGVYEHRPACCRVYPLARLAAPGQGGGPPRVRYVRQDTPGCLGWRADDEMTPAAYAADQALGPYDRHADRLLGLLMHPRRRGKVSLNPRQTHAFIMALYNPEVFAQMLAQPGFAQRAGLDRAQVEAALADEEACLALGQDWLTRQLFP